MTVDQWLAVRDLLIDERNWCKGKMQRYRAEHQQNCLYGAMYRVSSKRDTIDGVRQFIAIHGIDPASLNDDSTHVQVIAAIDRTIAYLREQGAAARRQAVIDGLKDAPAEAPDEPAEALLMGFPS